VVLRARLIGLTPPPYDVLSFLSSCSRLTDKEGSTLIKVLLCPTRTVGRSPVGVKWERERRLP
ncbi:MAG: hypothetical protein ACXV5I_09415, partial [Halobacteriota archaeon]